MTTTLLSVYLIYIFSLRVLSRTLDLPTNPLLSSLFSLLISASSSLLVKSISEDRLNNVAESSSTAAHYYQGIS